MTNLPNPTLSQSESGEKSTEKIKNSSEQNISASKELEKAVYQAQRAVLEKITKYDNLKSVTEEEIDRQIIHDEIDPVVKAEDRLTTAVHLKLLPEFIKYYLTNNKTKTKQASLKQIFRLFFSSFLAGGKNSLEIILPILEVIDSGDALTPDVLMQVNQEVGEKIIFWLGQELNTPGDNQVKTLETLKEIIDDLNLSEKNEDDDELNMDKKTTLIKLIKRCDLLINEAKIRLIEKVAIFTDTEISQMGKLLASEIDFSKKNKNLIIMELLSLLKELEKNIITH